MNCLECQALLQERLDGTLATSHASLERHLSECALCREQHAAAVQLMVALKQMPAPTLPDDFADAMTARVLLDRRQRMEKMRRRVVLTAALAASVLFMLLFAYFWVPRTPDSQSKGEIAKEEKKIDPPPAHKAPEKKETPNPEPRHVLVALPDRVADTTLDHGKVLIAAAKIGDMDKLPIPLAAIDPGIGDASQEVGDGVRVITKNTRRAFDYFTRELPMPSSLAKGD